LILRTGIRGLLRRDGLIGLLHGRHRRRLMRGGPVLMLCRRLVLVRRLGRRALHRRNSWDHRGLRRRPLIRWRGLVLLLCRRLVARGPVRPRGWRDHRSRRRGLIGLLDRGSVRYGVNRPGRWRRGLSGSFGALGGHIGLIGPHLHIAADLVRGPLVRHHLGQRLRSLGLIWRRLRRPLIRWRGLILLDSRPRLILLVLHRRLVGRLIRLLGRWLVRRTHQSGGLLRGRDRLIWLLGHGSCLHRPLGRGHGRGLRCWLVWLRGRRCRALLNGRRRLGGGLVYELGHGGAAFHAELVGGGGVVAALGTEHQELMEWG